MGCVASKLEEEEVIAICKERKGQLKVAVERRYALAEAHCKYFYSLYAVAASINLFVACHSSPSLPFLITLPPPCPAPSETENVINNPMFLQQTSFEPKHEAITRDSGASSATSESESSEEEREEKGERETEVSREGEPAEQPYGYYYMQMPPSMPSPQRDFEWDFFNPFECMRTEVISGYRRNSDDDLRLVREEEGIPELEEVGERGDFEQQKVVTVEENEGAVEYVSGNVERVTVASMATQSENQREQRGLAVIDTPEEGRDLLEALKDIEDYFVRAYNAGINVTRMLEANRIPLQSGLEEIKENSIKLINAITWHRSTSKSSSCKSLVVSDAKNSSTWTEYENDLFDDYGGMNSGSHSLTLGRLYAWEKKLYEEVKAGDKTRKNYEKKCAQLRNKDVRGDDVRSMDNTRIAVKDLYAGILIAIRRAESISKRIQKIRDEELQPQIVELLEGLSQTWQVTLESHETQRKILSEVKSFTCPTYGKFCNESHRLATVRLEGQLRNWHVCFKQYIAAQKAYAEALYGWLSKFVVPEVEFYSRNKNVAVPCQANGPPLLEVCHDWLASLRKLPDEMVTLALKSVVKDVRALWVQQGEEQQQKRKVDSLSKDLDRRDAGLNKVKSKMLESRVTDQKPEVGTEHQEEYVMEKRDHMEAVRRKLEIEKEKHHSCMQETQRIMLHGLQLGFSQVFESLTEFSKASRKMYSDLATFSENADKGGAMSHMEGSSGEHYHTQT